MITLRKKLQGIVFVILVSGLCYSQDLVSDFEQLLAALQEKTVHSQQELYYHDMEDEVNGFVAKHKGASVVEFLEGKISEPNSRKPALISLAGLVATDKAAEDALYRQIYGEGTAVQRDALVAICCIDHKYGRPIAETVASRPAPWGLRKAAIEMLVGLGDQNTLETLKQTASVEENSYVKAALASAIPQLEYRLTEVPLAEQAEWAQNEILLWRTVRESPGSRLILSEVSVAAKALHTQGYNFSQEYLEYKLNTTTPFRFSKCNNV